MGYKETGVIEKVCREVIKVSLEKDYCHKLKGKYFNTFKPDKREEVIKLVEEICEREKIKPISIINILEL